MAPHRPQGSTPRLVTLSTDLGWAYAAQMKAVLYRRLPPGSVVDLAHDLPAYAVGEAAFLVRAMAERFPAGSVHVVVVDPGVGGRRAPLAVECADGTTLVGPDNGVLAPLAQALGRPRGFRLEATRAGAAVRVGTTFDGRDLFAPAAARLALGEPAARLGPPHPLRLLRLDRPTRTPGGASGVVVHLDRFGNLVSNVPGAWAPRGTKSVRLRFGGGPTLTVPWADSYESIGAGRLGGLVSSFGTVEVAVARGHAARRVRARAGTRLRIAWRTRGSDRATETVNSGRSLRQRGR